MTSTIFPSPVPFFTQFQANSTATCLPGDVVLSGGYRINVIPPFTNILHHISVETEETSTEDGWTVDIHAGLQFSLVSIAKCFNNP